MIQSSNISSIDHFNIFISMFDTIIVGAGIAGLAAGQYLTLHEKSDFLILECSDHLGGRVGSVEFDGKTFSSGPGWLHGRRGNPIYDIIVSIGVPIECCKYETEAYFVWDVKERKEITDLFAEKSETFEEIYADSMRISKEVKVRSDRSVFDQISINSRKLSYQSDLDKTVIFGNKEIYMGAPLTEISAFVELTHDKIYEGDGEENNFRILDPFGVTKMVEFFSESFKSKIKFNLKVVEIIWDRGTHTASVITSDGQQFRCHNVIVTLASTLLARNAISFQPELPESKVNAWNHIRSVNYCRIFAKFPRRFWPDRDWLIAVLEDVDPFNSLIFWQNCCKQKLCSADDNILVCHCTSGFNEGGSRFNVDKMTLTDMVAESMENMFPTTFCSPDDVLFVSHLDDERFAGAFSICIPGFDEAMVESLCESVGPLHFAGESVSVELMGTMQAAYVTGRKAARSAMD